MHTYTGLYTAIQSYAGLYWAILGYTGLYTALQSYTELYRERLKGEGAGASKMKLRACAVVSFKVRIN